MLLPKQPHYIGVDREKSMAKIALVRVSAKRVQVLQCKMQPWPSSFSPQYGYVCTALPSQVFFSRSLELPLLSKRDLAAAITFHAQQILPYPMEQAILQHSILGRTEETMRINLFAVKKEAVSQHIQAAEKTSLISDIIVSTPVALAALSQHLISVEEAALILHFGESESSVVLVQGWSIRRHYAFSATASPSLEIKKILFSLLQSGKECAFSRIILIGFCSEELKSLIEDTSGKRVEQPHSESISLSSEKWAQYGLAIGIAIAAAAGYNFKQKSKFPLTCWIKRYYQALCFFCGGLAICFALLAGMMSVRTAQMERIAKRKMESLLMDQEVPGNRMESIQDYRSLLRLTERKIGEGLNQFAVIPDLPSIGEIISWICTYFPKEKTVLQELHYDFIQAPSPQNPSLPYHLRISIDLRTTLSPHALQGLIETSALQRFLEKTTVFPSDNGAKLELILRAPMREDS